jgi:hypothetical protein
MTNSWAPERRERQGELIKTWRPWEQSTGPRTEAGKAASARNSRKHGNRSRKTLEHLRELRAYLRECKEVTD